MPIAMPTMIDPLKAFTAGGSTGAGRPIPLVSTRFDVDIDGGLVTVVTKRVFRNDELSSIEATITFPIPVHAVLFDLEARIDGRVVKARAQRRTEAREKYEDAIERGKTAVLHEEVLRGVHMLSVAHLGPGREIEVTSTWVSALSFVGDRGQVRIPLTVGDIYGRSGLSDSDDLLTGGAVQTADLFVRCKNGVVEINAARLDEGRPRVALNAPIDLFVTNAADQELRGVAADGREVTLRVSPHRGGNGALNVAVVVDRSGSMGVACSSQTGAITKHDAVVRGLTDIAQNLGEADIIDLWEFDDQFKHVGSSRDPGSRRKDGRQRLLSRIARLRGPGGGTEIGAALSGTMAGSDARDVLLITDGQSYALDVHALAQKGRRITVVLVGEDSLEANVGHLAALSGGDIFVATGDDIAELLATAIGALRAPSEQPGPAGASLDRVRVVRGNAVLEAEWRRMTVPAVDATCHRSVAAMAASLALPSLGKEHAAVLAQAEGLVTHLTSLVLVDEAGEVQAGVPANRKIALPAPAVAGAAPMGLCRAASTPVMASYSADASRAQYYECRQPVVRQFRFDNSAPPLSDAGLNIVRIDWDISPNRLLAGDLSGLDLRDAAVIKSEAERPEVIAFAELIGTDPIVLVLAAVAQSQSSSNRSAARVAKAILGNRSPEELRVIAEMLGVI
jgi:Vault protein inter-alpha-trypsin domain/von Willebrand factor type A domain